MLRRSRRVVLLAVSFFAATLPLFAQRAAYDVTRYDLRIEPDLVAKTLSVNARVDIDNPANSQEFAFGLSDHYSTVNVTSRGTDVTFRRNSGVITVFAAKPLRRLSLEFAMSGPAGASADDPRDVITDSSLYLLWSDRFYPIDFDDWAQMRTTVVLPSQFEVVAPGKRVSTRDKGVKRETVFETSMPIVSASVIADSGWTRAEREANGMTIVTYLDRNSLRYVEPIMEMSGEIISFFSSKYAAYPFDSFAFVTIPGINARRAFPGFVGYSPEYLEKEMDRTGYDAHETSLLWWGYLTHGSGPAAMQWTEGFGDYAEFLYGEKAGKPLPKNFATFRQQYLQRADEPAYTEVRGNMQDMVHGKFPWLMHVMRYRIGDAAFDRGMKMLFERFARRTFTIDDFIATMQEAAGTSLAWWRDEWLDRRAHPDWISTATTRTDGTKWTTTVSLTQKANVYHIPVEVTIETPGGAKSAVLDLRDRVGEVNIDSDAQPSRVIIDPRGWILSSISTIAPDPAAPRLEIVAGVR